MRRRELSILLSGAALTLSQTLIFSLTAHAQQQRTAVIGILSGESPDQYDDRVRAFREGLRDAGFFEGRNLSIESRWAHRQYDRLPALAAELVRRRVNLIVTVGGVPPARAAQTATTTIPIVFHTGSDPVAAGLVASLASPGGNITGVTNLGVELGQKKLEILHELIPTTRRIAVLINPANASADTLSRDALAGGRSLGLEVIPLLAGTKEEFESAFAKAIDLGVGGLEIAGDAFFVSESEHLGALSVRYSLPTIFQYRAFAASGGLIAYGSSATDMYRLAGGHASRILKGEKPADLPVMQSTKIELIINLKTARTLGIKVPLPLLGRADEVIE
jgi:putative ABC transport system substrate-binding protein